MTTNELFTNMKAIWNEFEEHHDKFITKGHKTSGTRARKTINELKKLVTEYRKTSILESRPQQN
jgi:hypothetical protein